jgi:hypothetical protein
MYSISSGDEGGGRSGRRPRASRASHLYLYVSELHVLLILLGVAVTQAVQCLTTDWTTEIRSPTETEDFSSSPYVQTGSGAHPASCPMGTRGFPGVKRGRGVMMTTHPHLVPRLRMSRSYTSSHPMSLHGV